MVSVTYLACESYKILSYFRIIIPIFINPIIIDHTNNVSVYEAFHVNSPSAAQNSAVFG